jgi:hypothetical protein
VIRVNKRQPSHRVAYARLLAPIITLILVVANYNVQGKIAMANAGRIIQACEEYRKNNGAYPERLDDLIPRYLNSVPRAKYCLQSSDFRYFVSPEPPQNPILHWYQVPPFGRKVYDFETGEWHYVD